jgi:hypothetical protein
MTDDDNKAINSILINKLRDHEKVLVVGAALLVIAQRWQHGLTVTAGELPLIREELDRIIELINMMEPFDNSGAV